MDVLKAYNRRDKLTRDQLVHLQQLLDVEIVNYKRAIENYPADRMEKYGEPFLGRLQKRADDVAKLLEAEPHRL
jgi:hypothetical protein